MRYRTFCKWGIGPAIAALLVLAAGVWSASGTGQADAASAPRNAPETVVVELFTSQSCSSCPPADAFLGELARRPGVLALSLHVDYWNALGWRDTLSSREATERQRSYARSLGTRYLSTPQVVVDGRAYAVGSDRATVNRLIAEARAHKGAGVVPKLSLDGKGHLKVHLPDNHGIGEARVWMVAFDNRNQVAIPSGENAGRKITYVHSVRELKPIGTWSGKAKTIVADISDEPGETYQNCAVLVQAPGPGPIIGAASLAMPGH